MRAPREPCRIKMVEPIRSTTSEELGVLRPADQGALEIVSTCRLACTKRVLFARTVSYSSSGTTTHAPQAGSWHSQKNSALSTS